MTRENKLALVVGFGLILFIGILISDHFSVARSQTSANLMNRRIDDPLVTQPRNEPDLIALKPEPPPVAPLLQPGEPAMTTAQLGTNNHAIESMTPEQRSMINRDVNLAQGRAPEPSETTGRVPRDVEPIDTLNPREGTAQLTMQDGRSQDEVELPGFVRVVEDQPVNVKDVRFHDVKGGESMFAICKQYYGTTELVDALAKFNKMDDPASLRQGRRLLIPPPEAIGGKAKAPPAAKPNGSGTSALRPTAIASSTQKPDVKTKPAAKTYTVKPGDSLSGIAQRMLGDKDRWRDLHKLNRKVIEDPDKLKTGTVLKLG